MKFVRSDADMVIYGGSAGGGKSFALLIDPLRDINNPRFGAVIFRRTTTQIRLEGGLWDESQDIYLGLGARPRSQSLRWKFPSGAAVQMTHLEHEKTRYNYQGAQIAYMGFDELTHFTEKQFWYMVSRNRSASGVKTRIRATCNPDPDSFVRRLIDWWIDPETGYAIKERSGKIRFFVRVKDTLHWADTRKELLDKFGEKRKPRSLTFILSTVYDNKILLEKDENYLANLESLPLVERLQLMGEGDKGGNWNVRPSAGLIFKAEWFPIIDAVPAGVTFRCRFWDRAATPITPQSPDPDATVGVLVSKDRHGIFYVEDVIKLHASAYQVEDKIIKTAAKDGRGVVVAFRQDPGSAGKGEAENMGRKLSGYSFHYETVTGDKLTYAKPVSSLAEKGNIKVVKALWNKSFLDILENFDGEETGHDDEVDGLTGGIDTLLHYRPILVA
jgi:predicted phage terminase large subunit-like protein